MIRGMPYPRVTVVKVGEEWAVLLDGTDLVKAFPTWDAATAAARRLAAAEETDFVVAGNAAPTARAAALLSAQRDASTLARRRWRAVHVLRCGSRARTNRGDASS